MKNNKLAVGFSISYCQLFFMEYWNVEILEIGTGMFEYELVFSHFFHLPIFPSP